MALFALVLIVLAPPPVSAASNGSWQVLPTQRDPLQRARVFFVYELRPGAVLQDAITLSNLTDHPISFRLYATDAVNAAGNGAWALRPASASKISVGGWVRLETTTVTVPGQAKVDVPFQLRVPEDATPGDHAGGIVAANTMPDATITRRGATIAVVREVGVRMYLRVAGETSPVIRVTGVTAERSVPVLPYVTGRGRLTVRYRVRNLGNVRVAARSTLSIVDVTGRTIKSFSAVRLDDLLPGADVLIRAVWTSPPPIGRLTARVRLESREANASAATSVWFVPWFVVAAMAGFVGVAGVVWRSARRRRSSH